MPFQTTENLTGLPVKGGIEFLGGFLNGFIGDSHMKEIETCEIDAETEGKAVEKALADFKAGHKIRAITELKKIVGNFHTTLADCKLSAMTDDTAALKTWLTQFKDPKALIAHVTKRFLLHRSDIETDFQTLETDWQNKMYVQAGEAMADLVVEAIGPVEDSESEDVDVDVMEIPDFIAGFIYQLTGDNKLTEIEACY